LKSPDSRDEVVIRLEHDQPIRFGPEGAKSFRWNLGHLEVVDANSVPSEDLIVHDAHAEEPSLAFALSRLDSTDFAHTPIGIFRDVDRPTYDELMSAQLVEARETDGDGDLTALLRSTDTWTIDA
jgi:2-oxoglutarate ferredoxin oxidoreductase subunit beta